VGAMGPHDAEHGDIVACLDQLVDDMRADEAGASDHPYTHGVILLDNVSRRAMATRSTSVLNHARDLSRQNREPSADDAGEGSFEGFTVAAKRQRTGAERLVDARQNLAAILCRNDDPGSGNGMHWCLSRCSRG